MDNTISTVSNVRAQPIGLKVLASLAGAIAVAMAAQVAIPVFGSPVPFTLQPLAVVIVGGLLGPRYGALSLVMYLAMGMAGLPVFTPIGLPGFARLTGPTGGYLLAYPVAAAVVGLVVRRFEGPTFRLCLVGAISGMIVIHAGGMSQLMILTGSASQAFAAGLLPFVVNDIVKAILAALVIRRFLPSTRAI
jgi:biotin transport system substrate-specific component